MSVSLRRPMALVFAFALLAGGLCQLAAVRADEPCGNGTVAAPTQACQIASHAVADKFWVGEFGTCKGNMDTNNKKDCTHAYEATQYQPDLLCPAEGSPVSLCGDCYYYECDGDNIIEVPVEGLCAKIFECLWIGPDVGGSCVKPVSSYNYNVQTKCNICLIMDPPATCGAGGNQ